MKQKMRKLRRYLKNFGGQIEKDTLSKDIIIKVLMI